MCIYIMQASISSRTQRITDCRWTPKRRATSAWLTPCCNSLAAAIRRRSKPSKFRFTPAGLPILLSYHMYLYYASLNKSIYFFDPNGIRLELTAPVVPGPSLFEGTGHEARQHLAAWQDKKQQRALGA